MKNIMDNNKNIIRIDRNNIDEYYKKVNSAIDIYFGHSINPEKLKNYLSVGSSGHTNFKKRNEFDNIGGIDKVINDVLEDRLARTETIIRNGDKRTLSEKIIKFGDFKMVKEDSNIDNEQIDILGILSDHYDVSAGHIEKLTDSNNGYRIESGLSTKEINVIVMSRSDIEDTISRIAKNMYDSMLDKKLQYDKYDLVIDISDLVQEQHVITVLINKINAKLEFYLAAYLTDENKDLYYSFVHKTDKYHIFQKMS